MDAQTKFSQSLSVYTLLELSIKCSNKIANLLKGIKNLCVIYDKVRVKKRV